MAKLVEIADIFGIDKSEFDRGIPGGYEGIVYEATYEAQRRDGAQTDNESHWTGRYAASVWMFISGLTHPSVSRAWASAPSSNQPDGSLQAVQTASNPLVVRNSLAVGLRLQAHAFVLWKNGCSTPDSED